jgi:recombinational DNA repair protein (RecF pathway)
MVEYCGLRICRECFRKLFIVGVSTCANCGCTVENDELIEIDDGRKLCANCAHKLRARIMGVLA